MLGFASELIPRNGIGAFHRAYSLPADPGLLVGPFTSFTPFIHCRRVRVTFGNARARTGFREWDHPTALHPYDCSALPRPQPTTSIGQLNPTCLGLRKPPRTLSRIRVAHRSELAVRPAPYNPRGVVFAPLNGGVRRGGPDSPLGPFRKMEIEAN